MFAVPFEEIAPIVGRTPVADRQLARRARRRVQSDPAILDATAAAHREVVAAFLSAARHGDFEGLLRLLEPGTDNGGEAWVPVCWRTTTPSSRGRTVARPPPGFPIESCASGGMRKDSATLSVFQLQATCCRRDRGYKRLRNDLARAVPFWPLGHGQTAQGAVRLPDVLEVPRAPSRPA
ncbi:MAG: hypothetical protein ACRDZX_06630 [Acidimicrobiales bacterium]